ncbi:MAG: AbrB/MazE/SpoVT family DNA-binding domain-containing protein [Pseudomonadota bacterium]|jgi:hypothetical protein
MATSRKERVELLHQHSNDIARIQHCLLVNARTVTQLQAVSMWLDYSESHCAIWLQLPSDDKELLNILIQHLPSTTMLQANPPTWQAKLVDAGDDSRDAVLVLPDELLMQLGWDEDDTLEVSLHNDQITLVRKI